MSRTDNVSGDLPQKSTDDDVPTKPSIKKKRTFIKNAVAYFKEYCDVTGIHGLRYFGEARTIFEKIWWFSVFTACLFFCTLIIILYYQKWEGSPIFVLFGTQEISIRDIPFPAITVCSESKVKYDAFDYDSAFIRKRNKQNLTEREETFLDALSYTCNYREDVHSTEVNYRESKEFLDILSTVSPSFSIINCEFRSGPVPCEFFFTPIVTDEGICYTYNMLDRKEFFNENVLQYKDFHKTQPSGEWSIDHGYYKEIDDVLTFPRRALLIGATFGLKFELQIENERLDTMCKGSGGGYKILLHGPVDIPRPSLEYLHVPYNQSLSVTIKPSYTTSQAVIMYSPQKRRCFFSVEKYLSYFKIYSQKNCVMECLTNFTLFYCDCLTFYMPGKNGTRICKGSDYKCTLAAARKKLKFLQKMSLYKNMPVSDVDKSMQNVSEVYSRYTCECLPLCSDIVYNVGSTLSYWDWTTEIANEYKFDSPNNNTNYYLSKVTAYFTTDSFIASVRSDLYSATDFIASFGGFLGLFTGFSILSLIEIIYFLSVRVICNIYLYGNWAG